MDTCCFCEKKVIGAILLCDEHWEEYAEKAKGDFKTFQQHRKKLAEALLKKD